MPAWLQQQAAAKAAAASVPQDPEVAKLPAALRARLQKRGIVKPHQADQEATIPADTEPKAAEPAKPRGEAASAAGSAPGTLLAPR